MLKNILDKFAAIRQPHQRKKRKRAPSPGWTLLCACLLIHMSTLANAMTNVCRGKTSSCINGNGGLCSDDFRVTDGEIFTEGHWMKSGSDLHLKIDLGEVMDLRTIVVLTNTGATQLDHVIQLATVENIQDPSNYVITTATPFQMQRVIDLADSRGYAVPARYIFLQCQSKCELIELMCYKEQRLLTDFFLDSKLQRSLGTVTGEPILQNNSNIASSTTNYDLLNETCLGGLSAGINLVGKYADDTSPGQPVISGIVLIPNDSTSGQALYYTNSNPVLWMSLVTQFGADIFDTVLQQTSPCSLDPTEFGYTCTTPTDPVKGFSMEIGDVTPLGPGGTICGLLIMYEPCTLLFSSDSLQVQFDTTHGGAQLTIQPEDLADQSSAQEVIQTILSALQVTSSCQQPNDVATDLLLTGPTWLTTEVNASGEALIKIDQQNACAELDGSSHAVTIEYSAGAFFEDQVNFDIVLDLSLCDCYKVSERTSLPQTFQADFDMANMPAYVSVEDKQDQTSNEFVYHTILSTLKLTEQCLMSNHTADGSVVSAPSWLILESSIHGDSIIKLDQVAACAEASTSHAVTIDYTKTVGVTEQIYFLLELDQSGCDCYKQTSPLTTFQEDFNASVSTPGELPLAVEDKEDQSSPQYVSSTILTDLLVKEICQETNNWAQSSKISGPDWLTAEVINTGEAIIQVDQKAACAQTTVRHSVEIELTAGATFSNNVNFDLVLDLTGCECYLLTTPVTPVGGSPVSAAVEDIQHPSSATFMYQTIFQNLQVSEACGYQDNVADATLVSGPAWMAIEQTQINGEALLKIDQQSACGELNGSSHQVSVYFLPGLDNQESILFEVVLDTSACECYQMTNGPSMLTQDFMSSNGNSMEINTISSEVLYYWLPPINGYSVGCLPYTVELSVGQVTTHMIEEYWGDNYLIIMPNYDQDLFNDGIHILYYASDGVTLLDELFLQQIVYSGCSNTVIVDPYLEVVISVQFGYKDFYFDRFDDTYSLATGKTEACGRIKYSWFEDMSVNSAGKANELQYTGFVDGYNCKQSATDYNQQPQFTFYGHDDGRIVFDEDTILPWTYWVQVGSVKQQMYLFMYVIMECPVYSIITYGDFDIAYTLGDPEIREWIDTENLPHNCQYGIVYDKNVFVDGIKQPYNTHNGIIGVGDYEDWPWFDYNDIWVVGSSNPVAKDEFIVNFYSCYLEVCQSPHYNIGIKISRMGYPIFAQEIELEYVIEPGQALEILLPEFAYESESAKPSEGEVIATALESPASWLKFEPSSMTISVPEGVTTSSDAGIYLFPIELSDIYGNTGATYYFSIEVLFLNTTTHQIGKLQVQVNKIGNSNGLEITLDTVTKFGFVQVEFSKPMLIPSDLAIITTRWYNGKVENVEDDRRRMLQSYSTDMELLLYDFQEEVDENGENKKAFTWRIDEFTESQMSIQVQFTNPVSISNAKKDLDVMQVRMMRNGVLFFDEMGTPIEYEVVLIKEVPKQYDSSTMQSVTEVLIDAFATTTAATILANAAMSMVVSAPLNQLWGMISSSQMIILIPMFRVTVPENAKELFSVIMEVATFDFVETGDTVAAMFDLPEKENPAYGMDELGMDQIWFIHAIGTVILVFVIYPIMLVIYLIFNLMAGIYSKVKTWKKYQELKYDLFWNFPITTIQEAYMILTLACINNVFQPDFTSTYGTCISSVAAIVTAILLVLYPPMISKLLQKKYKTLPRQLFLDRYSAAIDGYSNDQKAQYYHRMVFYYRRALLPFVIILPNSRLVEQFMTFTYSGLAVILVISYMKPLKEEHMHRAEMFNESMLILFMYHLFAFSDFVPDEETRYTAGTSLIYLICAYLGSYLVKMTYNSVKTCIFSIKSKYRIRNELKKRADKKLVKRRKDMTKGIMTRYRKNREERIKKMTTLAEIDDFEQDIVVQNPRAKQFLTVVNEISQSQDESSRNNNSVQDDSLLNQSGFSSLNLIQSDKTGSLKNQGVTPPPELLLSQPTQVKPMFKSAMTKAHHQEQGKTLGDRVVTMTDNDFKMPPVDVINPKTGFYDIDYNELDAILDKIELEQKLQDQKTRDNNW